MAMPTPTNFWKRCYEGVCYLQRSQKIETQQEKYSEIPIFCSTKVIQKNTFSTYRLLLQALELATHMSKYANASQVSYQNLFGVGQPHLWWRDMTFWKHDIEFAGLSWST